MGKFSKKFRQTKIISYIITRKRAFFQQYKLYQAFRRVFLLLKWQIKLHIIPQYINAKNHLLKEYCDIKIFRPDTAFSDFDIAFIAIEKNTKSKVFIQLVFNKNNKDSSKRSYEARVKTFKNKHKYYNIFYQEANKEMPSLEIAILKLKN